MWSEKYKSKIEKHLEKNGFSVSSIVDFWKSKDYSNIIEVSKNFFNTSKNELLNIFNCNEEEFIEKYGKMLVLDMDRANRYNKNIVSDYRRLFMFNGIAIKIHGGNSWDFNNGNKRVIKSYSDHHKFIISLEKVFNDNIHEITSRIGNSLQYDAKKLALYCMLEYKNKVDKILD